MAQEDQKPQENHGAETLQSQHEPCPQTFLERLPCLGRTAGGAVMWPAWDTHLQLDRPAACT